MNLRFVVMEDIDMLHHSSRKSSNWEEICVLMRNKYAYSSQIKYPHVECLCKTKNLSSVQFRKATIHNDIAFRIRNIKSKKPLKLLLSVFNSSNDWMTYRILFAYLKEFKNFNTLASLWGKNVFQQSLWFKTVCIVWCLILVIKDRI